MANIKNRHFGLDFVRAIAITVVVLSHTGVLLCNITPYFNHLSLIDGVDLFFVLSGLLIGEIILTTDFKTFSSVKLFLFRRWLRTLPNYYLFLIINIALVYFKLAPGMLSTASGYYLVFLQNLFKPIDIMFWESWSLVVEEWFYLILPILIFLMTQITRSKKIVYLCATLFLILFSLLSKFIFIKTHSTFNYNLSLRSIAIYRFDTLGFGLLLAYYTTFKIHFLKSFKWIGLLIFILYAIFRSVISEPISLLFFSTLACSCLIIFCYNYPSTNLYIKNAITLISKISYSMYLIHLPVYYILKPHFANKTGVLALLWFIIYMGLVYSLSFINFRYFECYFLKLRERKFTKSH